MSYTGKIYWHDGLFLQPQHFQGLQREVLEAFSFQNKIHKEYHYGVIECSLDYSLIENGYISFEALKVIMPNGIIIDVSNNSSLTPYKISFNSDLDSNILYIGVPLLKSNSANTWNISDSNGDDRCFYKLENSTYCNEDTGDDSTEVVVRKINAKLLLENDNFDGYEVLPLMRIERGINYSNSLKIVTDTNYIPPVININASARLKEFVHKTTAEIIFHAKSAKNKIHGRSEFRDNPDKLMISIMRLKVLNEYGVELEALLKNPNTTAFLFFKTIKRCIAALSTFVPNVNIFDILDYDHNNLYDCFESIFDVLSDCLSVSVEKDMYHGYDFKICSNNEFSVSIDQTIIGETSNYYIGIYSQMSANELIRIVEEGKSLKVIAPSTNTGKAVYGVNLKYQHLPSDYLPKKSGLYYFLICAAGREDLWKKILEEEEIMLVGAEDILKQNKFKLYTTILGS